MADTTQKCPMCAEQIPLNAKTCEYCGTRFEVTSTGYCQNCHQVREADENGQCKVCGKALTDLRVESKLIKEPVQEALPASQSIAQPEITKSRKSRLPIGILAGILILAVIGAVLWLGRNSIPGISSRVAPTPITTFIPTSTSAATLMPTATPTRTLRPTLTTTPIPAWVTEYVEPVLAAIANQRPHFQDDFSEESVSWRFDRDAQGEIEIKNGVLVTTIRQMGTEPDAYHAIHPAMRFQNFALRFEVDLSGLSSGDAARIHWRGTRTSSGIGFDLWKDGRWQVFASGTSMYLAEGYQSIDATREVTITIISRDTEYAIYIDETLVSYINDSGRTPGIEISLGVFDDPGNSTVVTFDNLKVWDLDKIQIQP